MFINTLQKYYKHVFTQLFINNSRRWWNQHVIIQNVIWNYKQADSTTLRVIYIKVTNIQHTYIHNMFLHVGGQLVISRLPWIKNAHWLQKWGGAKDCPCGVRSDCLTWSQLMYNPFHVKRLNRNSVQLVRRIDHHMDIPWTFPYFWSKWQSLIHGCLEMTSRSSYR